MYEKHIKVLERTEHQAHGELGEALEAAIALMRAAEPKDPAAEREHCEDAVRRNPNIDSEHNLKHIPPMLLRERAAVRAEVEAKYAAMLAPKDPAAERAHCEDVANDENNGLPQEAADTLMRERAAAYASGFEAGRREGEAEYAVLRNERNQAWGREARTETQRDQALERADEIKTRYLELTNVIKKALEAQEVQLLKDE
jgi:flagellar biosynthesis/type III secretory pathway protein FliH